MIEFIIGLVIIVLLIALSRLSESDYTTKCNGDCNQGRTCNCKGKKDE